MLTFDLWIWMSTESTSKPYKIIIIPLSNNLLPIQQRIMLQQLRQFFSISYTWTWLLCSNYTNAWLSFNLQYERAGIAVNGSRCCISKKYGAFQCIEVDSDFFYKLEVDSEMACQNKLIIRLTYMVARRFPVGCTWNVRFVYKYKSN